MPSLGSCLTANVLPSQAKASVFAFSYEICKKEQGKEQMKRKKLSSDRTERKKVEEREIEKKVLFRFER